MNILWLVIVQGLLRWNGSRNSRYFTAMTNVCEVVPPTLPDLRGVHRLRQTSSDILQLFPSI